MVRALVVAVLCFLSAVKPAPASTMVLGFGPYSGMSGTVSIGSGWMSSTGDGVAPCCLDYDIRTGGPWIYPEAGYDNSFGGTITFSNFAPIEWRLFGDVWSRTEYAIFDMVGTPGENFIKSNTSAGSAYVQLNTSPWRVIQPIPVPAALPMLATAAGALGFIGWRRSRVART
jgi:hypothetical protein